MALPIDLNDVPVSLAAPQVDLNTGYGTQPISLATAYTRSVGAYMGLKNKVDKSFQDYYDGISQGGEDSVRADVSAQLDAKVAQSNVKSITDIASQGSLTPEKLAQIQLYTQAPKTNPNTVFEKHYAEEYMNFLNWPKNAKDTGLSDLAEQHPDVAKVYKDIGTELQTKNAILWKEAEDADEVAKNQSWLGPPVELPPGSGEDASINLWGGYIGDKLKENLIPLYYQLKMRAQTQGVSIFAAAGLSSQLEAQSRHLLSLPVDEMQRQYHDVMTKLKEDNPSLAVTFAAAMIGQSTAEKVVGDALTVGELPVISAIGTSAFKLARGATRVGTGLIAQRRFNAAVRQMVEGADAATTRPPEVVAAAAAGDMETAATNQVVHNITDHARGIANAEKEALEATVSTLRIDQTQAAGNPGNFGQDMVNRMNQVYGNFIEGFSKLISRGAAFVERTPAPFQIEEVVNAAKQEMVDRFPNAANMIMDSSKIYVNPVTKTYHVDFHFWDRTGKLFPYEGNADAAARYLSFVPSKRTIRGTENERVATELSKIDQQIRDLRREPSGPSMSDLDTTQMIKDLEAQREQWLTYHADVLGSGEDVVLSTTPGYTVHNQGAGWYFTVTKPLNETSHIWRDGLLKLDEAVSPQGLITALTGRGRTPEETLSFFHNLNRKISTYAPAKYLEFIQEMTPSIQAIYKGVIKYDPITGEKRNIIARNIDMAGNRKNIWIHDFERILEAGRTMIDPDTKLQGYFFKNPAELEYFARRSFGRSPDPVVVDGYFEFKRVAEMDRALRNNAIYKNMSRVGTEAHQLAVKTEDGQMLKSGFFNAVKRDVFPGGQDTIALIGEHAGEENLTFGDHVSFGSKLVDKLRKGVESKEYSVLELYAPENKDLSGFAKNLEGHRVRYVVVKTKQLETRPIDFDQLGRRGGGHIEYDYRHYIKQAKVTVEQIGSVVKHWYEGDVTVMPIELRAMGQDIVDKLNNVRIAFKNKDEAAAKLAAQRLPMPYDEIHGWFHDKVDPNGIKVPARLGLNEPLQIVDKDISIIDMDKTALQDRYTATDGSTTLNDGTRRGSLASQNKVAFTTERDSDLLNTLVKRNIDTPLYNVEPARLVDPITMMNRSVQKIVNSTFMDDYKIFSVEHWVKEARPFLVAEDSEILHSPFYHFEHPVYRVGVVDPDRIRLETQRLQIKAFVGESSVVQSGLDYLGQQLADSMYNTGTNTRYAVASGWTLSKITRPLDFFRAWVQHATLGFFNINQILVQSASYGTILGVAGGDAIPGTFGALLHQMSRVNSHPNILNALETMATKMGAFKPGEFLEARNGMLRTGFEQVGSEHVMLNDQFDNFAPKIVVSKLGRFLSASDMFFKGTERNTRFGAWYTAYKEWRNENPTAPLDNLNLGKVLERADLLAGNMSKASRSMLQHGILAFPTQFLAYQMRLAELFTGKRLDWVEKARLFGVYGGLYGVPAATGLSAIPFGDWWRKSALENGYIVGDKFLSTLFNEGGLGTAMAYMTGTGDLSDVSKRIRTGNYYNFSQKLGANGMNWIRDILTSDKSWWKILGGASGQWFENALQLNSGFYRATQSYFKDDPNTQFPITLNDFTDPVRTISAGNNAIRAYLAAQTAVWYGKNEAKLMTDITPRNAFALWVTGLTPTEVTDLQYSSWTKNTRLAAEKEAENQFAIEHRRGLRDQSEGNTTEALKHFIRANTVLKLANFPLDRMAQALARANEGYEDLIWHSRWEMYMGRDVPEDQKADLQKTFTRLREIQQEKMQGK